MAVDVVRVAMAFGVHHGALGPICGGLDALSGQIGLDHVPVLCIHGKVAGNSALFKNREYHGNLGMFRHMLQKILVIGTASLFQLLKVIVPDDVL